MPVRLLISATLLLLVGPDAWAGGAPDNVVLVVNAESWESRLIANEYRALRRIPSRHLIEVGGLSNRETIPVDEFRDRILGPVTAALEERGLTAQIDYVLYSADIPTAIQLGNDLQRAKLPQVFTPVGSVNGLTFLHSLVRQKDARYLEMRANRYARQVQTGSDDADLKSVPIRIQPTLGFRADSGWSAKGQPVAKAEGPSYWLSTVLAVTRGRGLTVSEAVDNLKRSVAADRTRPRGTVYFEQNDDIRSTTREWAFKAAAERLESLGVKAVVERGILPSNREDVAGAVIGAADFDWTKSGSRILPGAICEHLTSFGGILSAGAGQTPLTEFLRHGAAGSSGTVTEPYAIQAKFPSPLLHVHYAEGCSLAEAFYQSVSGPYQLLIVGDALCQPWGRRIDVRLAGLPDSREVTGTIPLKPTATSPDGVAVAEFELYIDGRRVRSAKPGEPLELDTSKLDDGHHDLALLAIGSDPVRTIGRLQQTIVVGNSVRKVVLRCPAEQPWDKPLTVEADAPGSALVEVLYGTRIVGKREGGTGTIAVDPQSLGPGPVELVAVAKFDAGRPVRSAPLTVRIGLPPDGK